MFISCSAGILFGVLVAAASGFWLVRAISSPPEQAARVARSVAAGNLTQSIGAVSDDETGQLMHGLKERNASLVKIVGQARSVAGAIASGLPRVR